jgi:hypothetical protein
MAHSSRLTNISASRRTLPHDTSLPARIRPVAVSPDLLSPPEPRHARTLTAFRPQSVLSETQLTDPVKRRASSSKMTPFTKASRIAPENFGSEFSFKSGKFSLLHYRGPRECPPRQSCFSELVTTMRRMQMRMAIMLNGTRQSILGGRLLPNRLRSKPHVRHSFPFLKEVERVKVLGVPPLHRRWLVGTLKVQWELETMNQLWEVFAEPADQ